MRRGVVVVGMVGLVAGALSWPGPGLLVARQDAVSASAFWLLLAAGAVALLRPRLLRVAALVPAVAGGVALVRAAALAVGTGLPAVAVGVLVAGGSVTVVGVAWGSVREPAPAPRWRAAAAGSAALAVTAGLAVGFDAVAWRHPVVARVAAPAAPAVAAAVETRPERVAWTWRDAAATEAVLAAGPGVVVARADGLVVGLDGRTGAVRWAAGRAGARAAVSVTPDRRTVVVLLRAGNDRADEGGRGPARLAVIDADTGATRWEDDLGGFSALTDRVLVGGSGSGSGSGAVARSLVDGSVAWTAPSPAPACTVAPGAPVGADVAVLEWRCRGGSTSETVLQGHDATSGALRWRFVAERSQPRLVGRGLVSAPDGGVLVWEAELLDPGPDGSPSATFLLDPGSGALTGTRADEAIRLSAGSRPVSAPVLAFDEGTRERPEQALSPGGPVPLPMMRCAPVFTLAAVATDDATVRVCRGLGGVRSPVLQLDDREPVVLPIGPGRYRDVAAETDGPDPNRSEAFAVPAPGAFVIGVRQQEGSTLLGFTR